MLKSIQVARSRVFFRQGDPISLAQELIAAETADADRLADLVARICAEGLWKEHRRRDGGSFESLTQFVVTSAPHGLGVRTDAALRKLRTALIANRLFGEWLEVMEGAVRPSGRPKKNFANSEDLPIFRPARSTTAIDRILPRLMREHPDLFEEVKAGNLSVHGAAVQAGIVRPPRKPMRLRFGAVDFGALAHVEARARARLLCEVFDALGVEAQCALLASRLEGTVGVNLAQEWRECRSGDQARSPAAPEDQS